MKGRLRYFNRERGWGLIEPDGKGADIFVHVSQIVAGGEPEKDERCIFDVAESPAGKVQAVRVYMGG
jgi:CspA family cold shock protein